MHLSSLVEMVESAFDDRVLLGTTESPVTGADVGRLTRAGASTIEGSFDAVVYVGENHPMLPIALLASAWAGVPLVPVNYRLADDQLNALVARQTGALVLADPRTAPRLTAPEVLTLDDWIDSLAEVESRTEPADDDEQVAVVLYTSGTTSEPKAALLRHRHLMAYLLGSVEFGGAASSEAALVSVPPYHIAGMANLLSNLFAGRRLVYLPTFDAHRWLQTVRAEKITHAMLVPTMLARIVDALGGGPSDTPSLHSLSYGGASVSERVIVAALEAFASTGFVNAYGLTETASTIAVLGPAEHRDALSSGDPAVRRRLSSVGRLLPEMEIEIRDDLDRVVLPGEVGIIHLRGEQVSGEYSTGSVLDADGWFCTRDRGAVDAEGYLFIEGRADDTIIRGGENIAPAEIEEVLYRDDGVAEVCVVGVPDDEWGQRIVAVVVPRHGNVEAESLRELVRSELRGSKTPDLIVFRDELPHTETGKLLRRVVLQELCDTLEP